MTTGWPASPGTVPTTDGWPAPVEPPRRRYRWLFVLLAVLFVLMTGAGATVAWFVHEVEPPVDAMNHYLAAVRARNYDRAYDLLCGPEQRNTSRTQFPDELAPFVRSLDRY